MSGNITVFQLAKEFDIKALELIDKIKSLTDVKVKNHMAELTAEEAEKIRNFLNPPKPEAPAPKKRVVTRKSAPKDDSPSASTTVIRRRAGAEPEAPAPGESVEAPEVPVAASMAPVETSAAETEFTPPEMTEEAPGEVSAVASDAPEAAAPTDGPGDAAAPAGRGPRFSVIRVVSPEQQVRARPLIVEEAPAGGITYGTRRKSEKSDSAVPKTFMDPDLARTGSSLIRQLEEEENRKKKGAGLGVRRGEELNFKSTDYLRRERVYQVKKKRLSIGQAQKKTLITTASAHKRVIEFDDTITVSDLAEAMAVKVYDVIKKLRGLGVHAPEESEGPEDWFLDLATVQLVAAEYEFEVRDVTFSEEQHLAKTRGEDDADAVPRPAVVTIMGHVDHGKTSLLDVIRRARVASGEAGGITQHIGAYTVTVSEAVKNLTAHQAEPKDKKDKKKGKEKGAAAAKGGAASSTLEMLTFLDTPGHAAFTSMRARGASVTDIVVLVVSAVDGVMPQTREAVEHAKAAEVPLIVAVNKMDLPDANPDRIRQQLSELGLMPEDWGGETIYVPLSAKTGEGVDKLLEMIQLQAEVLELKASPKGHGQGTLIEAKLDKGRGPVATVLVQTGTLHVGDYICAGTQTGKVRALIDDKGKNVKEAGPSMPVEILGLGGVPEAGDILAAFEDEKSSKDLAVYRTEQKRLEAANGSTTLEQLYARMAQGELVELPILLKADVKGSAEALQFALGKIPQTKVRLKILSASVGAISESDILLASASKGIIFGFNVRPDAKAEAEAERRGVQIKTYTIIYELIDEVTKAMEGMLAPTQKETVMGRAEVRNVFNITKAGTVAGSAVTKGKIQRSNLVRLLRDNRVIYTGKLSGLKRFKDDAREVAEGFECGISIENYNDVKVGDIIEAYTVENVAASLTEGAPAQA